MNKIFVLWFIFFTIGPSYACVANSHRMIDELGIIRKFYPHNYVVPSIKFRKFFKLKKRPIPKWIYRELCMSILFWVEFFIGIIVYCCFKGNEKIAGVVLSISAAIVACYLLHTVICYSIYQNANK